MSWCFEFGGWCVGGRDWDSLHGFGVEGEGDLEVW
jgi:hypothetical protein